MSLKPQLGYRAARSTASCLIPANSRFPAAACSSSTRPAWQRRVLAPLLRLVDEADGKLLLVGDPAQLPAVGAGGLFPALCEQLDAIELTGNRRQRDPLERQALARLREGDPEPYLAHAARSSRLNVDTDATAARQRLLEDWWQDASRDRSRNVMLAYRREDVQDLNQAAHELMRRSGRLGRQAVSFDEREFRVGDQVVCRRNDTRLGLRNGTRGTIVNLDETTLTMRDDNGARRQISRAYAAENLDYGYALTGHAAQGATVDRAYVLLPDHGALQEWGYVACTRARTTTRLYLADRDTLERETQLRQPDPATATERAAHALERPAAESLALYETTGRIDVNARLHARRDQELQRQRAETVERLATAQRDLEQLGWWKRGPRRLELRGEIGLYQTSLRLADAMRAQPMLERDPATTAMPSQHYHGDLMRAPSLQPGRGRTIEREPPGLSLEV